MHSMGPRGSLEAMGTWMGHPGPQEPAQLVGDSYDCEPSLRLKPVQGPLRLGLEGVGVKLLPPKFTQDLTA